MAAKQEAEKQNLLDLDPASPIIISSVRWCVQSKQEQKIVATLSTEGIINVKMFEDPNKECIHLVLILIFFLLILLVKISFNTYKYSRPRLFDHVETGTYPEKRFGRIQEFLIKTSKVINTKRAVLNFFLKNTIHTSVRIVGFFLLQNTAQK